MPFSIRYPDLSLLLQFTPVEKRQPFSHSQEWRFPDEQVDILYVYGLDPHCALLLQEWLAEKTQRHLIFLEDDLAAVEAFSHLPEAEEILNHPQIHLRFIADPQSWDAILEGCAIEFSFDKIDVLAVKAYENRPQFKKIKLNLLRKTVLWNALTSETISGHLLHQNIIPNLRRIPQCSYINAWKEAWRGTPLIICGAGPSLKAVAEDLSKVRDHALIIACGSALSAMSHLGIRPHLGIAIDPNGREFDCLSGCAYNDLPFLFGSRLYPKVFELFKGPYGYIRSGTGSPLESYVEEELGLNDPFLGYDLGREALSVTTLAVSLAQSWGCGPIIFAGVDLAYARERHYAEGVPVKAPFALHEKRAGDQVVRRKGAEGHLVPTLIKWIMERDTLDQYAKNHPETVFINASPGGLGFKHIPHQPLKEISFPPLCNYDEKVQSLLERTKVKVSASQVEDVLADVRKSLERCLELFQLLQLEEKESGKSVLYQSDLEAEIAYQLVLGSSKLSLERWGKRKDPSSLEREKWEFLEEATASYLNSI